MDWWWQGQYKAFSGRLLGRLVTPYQPWWHQVLGKHPPANYLSYVIMFRFVRYKRLKWKKINVSYKFAFRFFSSSDSIANHFGLESSSAPVGSWLVFRMPAPLITRLQRYKNYNDPEKLDTKHYQLTTTQRRTNKAVSTSTRNTQVPLTHIQQDPV